MAKSLFYYFYPRLGARKVKGIRGRDALRAVGIADATFLCSPQRGPTAGTAFLAPRYSNGGKLYKIGYYGRRRARHTKEYDGCFLSMMVMVSCHCVCKSCADFITDGADVITIFAFGLPYVQKLLRIALLVYHVCRFYYQMRK